MTILNYLARPWQAPTWFLVILVALNRWIFKIQLGEQSFPKNGSAAFIDWLMNAGGIISIGAIGALCMSFTLKLVKKSLSQSIRLNELYTIAIRSQSPYLLAVPLVVILLGVSAVLGPERAQTAARTLKGLLFLAAPLALFFLLKARFKELGEINLILLVLAPYVVLAVIAIAVGAVVSTALIGSIAYLALIK